MRRAVEAGPWPPCSGTFYRNADSVISTILRSRSVVAELIAMVRTSGVEALRALKVIQRTSSLLMQQDANIPPTLLFTISWASAWVSAVWAMQWRISSALGKACRNLVYASFIFLVLTAASRVG